jgi:DNA repair exonuclease SbcCD nuclease subunit
MSRNIAFVWEMCFTSRTSQSLEAMALWHWFLTELHELEINFFVIPGNHDKVDQMKPISYLNIFQPVGGEGGKSYQLIEEETALPIPDSEFGFAFLPYFSNKHFEEEGDFRNRLKTLIEMCKIVNKREGKKWILFTHQAFNGVKNNDGSSVIDGVPLEEVEFFHQVLVGHYHNAQRTENIEYIGSYRPQNFAENSDKGVLLIQRDGTMEREKLDVPEYINLKIDMSKVGMDKIERLRIKYGNNDNHILFRFQGTEEQLSLIDKKLFADVGIEARKLPVHIVEAMEVAREHGVRQYTEAAIEEEFERYCEMMVIEGTKYKFGKGLLKAAFKL